MEGESLRTSQDLLGHKTVSMTLRYAHLSPDHKLAAVEKLNPMRTGTNPGTRSRRIKADREASSKVLPMC